MLIFKFFVSKQRDGFLASFSPMEKCFRVIRPFKRKGPCKARLITRVSDEVLLVMAIA